MTGSRNETAFDSRAARAWIFRLVSVLDAQRDRIDGLNVFPVADADTGTNMYLTSRSGLSAVRNLPAGAPLNGLLDEFALGALRGARGNSGLILSVAFQGFARAFRAGGEPDRDADRAPADGAAGGESGRAAVGATVVADALRAANSAAWASVSDPVDGTMLTVLDRAACAASDCAASENSAAGAASDDPREPASTATMMSKCVMAGRAALEATKHELDVLERAHVVDAGGIGVLAVLECLAHCVGADAGSNDLEYGRAVARSGTETGYELIGELAEADTAGLKSAFADVGGTSMVLADGGGQTTTLHVHVPDSDAAHAGVDVLAERGTIRRVRVSSLVGARTGPAEAEPGMIAIARGTGLAATFALAGAEVLPLDDEPAATAGQLIDAIEALGNRDVILLPNSPITLAVAYDVETRAPHIDGDITVIPSRAHVQGLAAAAVFDRAMPADRLTAAMTEAAEATRHGAVIMARTAGSNGIVGPWSAGDVLGRVDGTVAVLGVSPLATARTVADRVIDDAELVTLVKGGSCPDDVVAALDDDLAGRGIDVTVLAGGPESTMLLIGAE